jgi:hypothetical protein
MAKEINNGRHDQNPDCSKQETSFPVAEGKTIFPGVFTKKQEDDQQRDDEIQDDAIPVFMGGQLVIEIHHQQQGRDNGDGHDLPVKVEFFAEESFHIWSEWGVVIGKC